MPEDLEKTFSIASEKQEDFSNLSIKALTNYKKQKGEEELVKFISEIPPKNLVEAFRLRQKKVPQEAYEEVYRVTEGSLEYRTPEEIIEMLEYADTATNYYGRPIINSRFIKVLEGRLLELYDQGKLEYVTHDNPEAEESLEMLKRKLETQKQTINSNPKSFTTRSLPKSGGNGRQIIKRGHKHSRGHKERPEWSDEKERADYLKKQQEKFAEVDISIALQDKTRQKTKKRQEEKDWSAYTGRKSKPTPKPKIILVDKNKNRALTRKERAELSERIRESKFQTGGERGSASRGVKGKSTLTITPY